MLSSNKTVHLDHIFTFVSCSVQAFTRRFSSQVSRNFQEKFPPILGCNVLSVVVIENLITSSELEESAEGEDEATSGRKRIRLWDFLEDNP